MNPGNHKLIGFFAFLVGVGLIYPLIVSGIFKLDLKTSMIVGGIFGLVGGVLWVTTVHIREKRRK